MPFDLSNIGPGKPVLSRHIADLYAGLTGGMLDQPITLAEALNLARFMQQAMLETPTVPPAGHMRLYPKADGNFYKLDENGIETLIGTDDDVGSNEVWFGPEQPSPRDDYLVWIDSDATEAPGPGAGTYVYTQLMPEDVWLISHGLDCFPSVTIVDTGNSVIIPNVAYIDSNVVVVSFGSPTSGKAYLN